VTKKRRGLVEWQEVGKYPVQGKAFDPEANYRDFNPALANPDILPKMEIAAPSTPQLLMGEAVEHLQGRQREIYMLTMREDKSLAEAAEILNIEKGTAQKYKERAIKFIEGYCKAAIAKGRV
jgi:DNA-directed RNA polymerase specialized sigma24 family protein